MLANHFAWKNKFLVNNACIVKNVRQHALVFQLASLSAGVERMGFSTDRTSVCFLGQNINPGFVSCMAYTAFPSLKQNLTELCCSYKSAMRKSQMVLNMHNNKHPLGSNVKGCGFKTHQTDSEDSSTTAPRDRKLYYVPGPSGKFGICLVHLRTCTFIAVVVMSCVFCLAI
jgi:hypothetical protein